MSTIGESSSSAERANSDPKVDTPKPAGDHDVEGATSGPAQKPSEQTPVDGEKLTEVLELLRSQLKSQQQQLDLLQSLTKIVVVGEAPALKRSPAHADYERAAVWNNSRIPGSATLEKLGKSFVGKRGGQLFLEGAAQRSRIRNSKGKASVVTAPHVLEEPHVPSREQLLLAAWPESLGAADSNHGFVWDRGIAIDGWHIYNSSAREGSDPVK